ncbi:MAG: hypothetical protein RRY12_10100 [Cloacibacillus sp.]
MIKISHAAAIAAKYLFITAVLASFVFIGYRIATKRGYEAHEQLQCRALAVSAALVASQAAEKDGALASLVDKEGEVRFIVDHRAMPGNYVVSVAIKNTSDGARAISAEAESGWNSRSPQKAAFSLKTKNGVLAFSDARQEEYAKLFLELQKSTELKKVKNGRLTFTYPFEKPCPAPFSAEALESARFSEGPVIILLHRR